MTHEIASGADVIVMDTRDHVATALTDLPAGQTFRYRIGAELKELTTADPIPFGHKVAITAIAKGDHVRKYGEVIGAATTDIEAGRHVHVHNVEGLRGRGDQANS